MAIGLYFDQRMMFQQIWKIEKFQFLLNVIISKWLRAKQKRKKHYYFFYI